VVNSKETTTRWLSCLRIHSAAYLESSAEKTRAKDMFPVGLNTLSGVAIFIICMILAKRIANLDHPKWGLYGYFLSIPIAIVTGITIEIIFNIIGIQTPEYRELSFSAYLFEVFNYVVFTLISCTASSTIFAIWMTRKEINLIQTPKAKLIKTVKISIWIWIFYGVCFFIIHMARGFRGENDIWYIEFDNLIFIVSWGVGMGYLLYFKKRGKLPTLEETLEIDKRHPVVYLRSFRYDEVRTKVGYFSFPRNVQEFFFIFIQPIIGIGFDELIQPQISSRIGPLIALGRPSDYLPMPGASRTYVNDKDWQSTVSKFIVDSSKIIFLESITEGVKWELEYITENCNPQKLFVVTFPKRFQLRREGWNNLQLFLANCGINVAEQDPGPGSVICFNDDWIGKIARRNCKNAREIVDTILEN
jgi:hypothetical protein